MRSPSKEVLQVRNALRCKFLGIDRSIWIFATFHGSALAILLWGDTELSYRLSGAFSRRAGSLTSDHLYIAFTAIALALHACLFARLYRSDPGWVPIDAIRELHTVSVTCKHCGAGAPLRSHHDFHTGQCIAKFDHFCPLLATSIGDRNHSAFWLYCIYQTFLIAWAFGITVDAIIPCFMADASVKVFCWHLHPARTWLLLAYAVAMVPLFNVFCGLSVLHGYLAATAQTTWELAKGDHVPYLQPHYERYSGPRGFVATPKGLASLIRQIRHGNPPPNPFSRGITENINIFLFARKPHSYSLHDAV